MKAKQNFTIYLNEKGNQVSHYSGDPMTGKTELKFRINDEIPDNIVADLLKTNPDFLQVEYERGQFKLTDEELVRFNMKSGKIERPPLIPKVRYTQDLLTRILNEKGVEELKKIAEEEFGMKDVKASKTLITKIYIAQNKLIRGG